MVQSLFWLGRLIPIHSLDVGLCWQVMASLPCWEWGAKTFVFVVGGDESP